MAVGGTRGARRGSSRRGGPSVRRKKVWARAIYQDSTVPVAGGFYALPLLDFENEYGADLLGCTIMRVRGQLEYTGDGPAVAAMRIITESSFATLGADDDPTTDRHADWFFYQPMNTGSDTSAVFDVDVQSMRKLDELGQTLLLAVGTADAAAGTFSAVLSILVALP